MAGVCKSAAAAQEMAHAQQQQQQFKQVEGK
jgi:hypothetical protein